MRWAVIALALLFPSPTAFTLQGNTGESQCLASAIHYEARGEPVAGRRAVLDTIINRMLATGMSACGVVYQRRQFAWADKKPLLAYTAQQRSRLSEVVGYPRVLIGNSYRHFYSGQAPAWADSMSCRRIYGQTFCKGG